MKYIFSLIFFLCFVIPGISAQEITDPEELFNEGEFFFLSEDYEEALFYYLQLLDKFSDNANFNFKVGMTYLQIPGRQHFAIPYLAKSIKSTSTKYKKRSYTESNAPHYAYFYLGQAYRINNDLEKALEIYQEFMDSKDFEGNYNLSLVENEVRACERAKIITDVPLNINQIKLDEPINTNVDNFNAVLSGDGNRMIFVTRLKFYDAINMSEKINGLWSEPVVLNPQVGSDGDLYPTSLSADGKELFMVKNTSGNKDIYVSRFTNTLWSTAVPLNENINTKNDESHASVSSDGMTLYFTSSRRGGYGGLDVYSSERIQNGDWGVAINLGININTNTDEETPFITKDGNRLFFSSQGHFNMGGFDIFYADMKEGGLWGDAINIGYPINTTGDNLFYYPIGDGTSALCSLMSKKEPIISDIYYIEILKKETPSEISGEFLFRYNFNLKVVNTVKSDTLIIHYNKDRNDFSVIKPEGEYRILIEK